MTTYTFATRACSVACVRACEYRNTVFILFHFVYAWFGIFSCRWNNVTTVAKIKYILVHVAVVVVVVVAFIINWANMLYRTVHTMPCFTYIYTIWKTSERNIWNENFASNKYLHSTENGFCVLGWFTSNHRVNFQTSSTHDIKHTADTNVLWNLPHFAFICRWAW